MNNISANILVVDDNEDILYAARLLLKQNNYNVKTESNPDRIPQILEEESFDIILLDMNFTEDVSGGQEGIHWLGKILGIDPLAVVIIITAYGDVELAVSAIKNGAMDFVQKPWQNEKLIATISAGISLRKSKNEISHLRSREQLIAKDINNKFKTIIGQSDSMKKVFSIINKVADTPADVLILGENGTGKELVAREIHRHSARAENIFMSVDMGAISESLFESELFG
ncbi:MAG: sigma 54-interacting transcriptional regulator, partial [Candidatus Zixiibacteriota bacterium]